MVTKEELLRAIMLLKNNCAKQNEICDGCLIEEECANGIISDVPEERDLKDGETNE